MLLASKDFDTGITGEAEPPKAHPVTFAVVELIVELEDADPLELTPLHDAIDPDALNALFDESESATRQIVFRYHGYEIVVEGAEQVKATSLEDDGT